MVYTNTRFPSFFHHNTKSFYVVYLFCLDFCCLICFVFCCMACMIIMIEGVRMITKKK